MNAGAGATAVSYVGPINATNAGVVVIANAGPTSVATAAVTGGNDAVVVSTNGTQTIALNGVTTGTAASGLFSISPVIRTITAYEVPEPSE